MSSSIIFCPVFGGYAGLDGLISIPVAFFFNFLQPKSVTTRHTVMYGNSTAKGHLCDSNSFAGSSYRGNAVTSMEPDDELVRRALQGDSQAFEFLVARHQDSVARYIWRMVPSSEDREEICQDVFVKVYFNLNKFRFDSKFSTWLYKISFRTALSFLRKKKLPMSSIGDELVEEFASEDKALESVSDETRVRLIIDREVSKLKLDERSIVTLFYLQEVGIDEIAEIVEKPAGTVKSILHRVRQKLKSQLKELAEQEPDRVELNEGIA
jgi:RNA polymerase sigma-70 factor (ECF subfamily)